MSFTGNIRKTPFSILIATQREMHQSKKAQRKNLVQAIYKNDTPKFPPLSLSFGYAVDTNWRVEVGISNIANYNNSWKWKWLSCNDWTEWLNCFFSFRSGSRFQVHGRVGWTQCQGGGSWTHLPGLHPQATWSHRKPSSWTPGPPGWITDSYIHSLCVFDSNEVLVG